MSRHTTLLFLLLATGCTGEARGGDEKAPCREPPISPERQAAMNAAWARQNGPPVDWLQVELTKVDDSIDGVEFSLSLPTHEQLERTTEFAGSVLWKGPKIADPGVSVELDDDPPTIVDQAIELLPQGAGATRYERLEGSGFLASTIDMNKGFVLIQAWRFSPTANKNVRVTVQAWPNDLNEANTLHAWMKTIARSLVVR